MHPFFAELGFVVRHVVVVVRLIVRAVGMQMVVAAVVSPVPLGIRVMTCFSVVMIFLSLVVSPVSPCLRGGDIVWVVSPVPFCPRDNIFLEIFGVFNSDKFYCCVFLWK